MLSLDSIPNEPNNPFLRAPFHHSPVNKQTSTTNNNFTLFDPNSIVDGKRSSAFAPYQKQEINIDTTNHSAASIIKLPPSESSSSSTNVFTNAPFKTKSKNKQRSTASNNISDGSQNMLDDDQSQQHGYSNLSFHDTVVDDYF